MKKHLSLLMVILWTGWLSAQTNLPVKLAIVPETPEIGAVADLLTVEFSKNEQVQLLERAEIEKVYREQGLSAANRDFMKLGKVLGADGLLVLDIVRTRQATNLVGRLIAVKPGVILADASFPWLLAGTPGETERWAGSIADGMNRFLPKLSLLLQEAIPISVVNLGSVIQSEDAKETEKELKLLTIQRLSQERQLFVLERQRMQLLAGEEDLPSDDPAFWKGGYLLQGSIDQNGYSQNTVTVNAHLTPPNGGQPLSFEVTGNRTNLAEVVNELAKQVTGLLKVNSVPGKSWEAGAEAGQYFDEANWALRWGLFAESQAAAEAAWALGKHDLECAATRIRAYLGPLQTHEFQAGEFTNPENTNQVIQMAVEEAGPNPPWGLVLHSHDYNGTKSVRYVYDLAFPDPADIELATRALELYYEFSRQSPEGLLSPAAGPSNWKNSAWYDLGIDGLVGASSVLQCFNSVPDAQTPVADKLVELRRVARQVADWISRTPVVHDTYFVGERPASYDELVHTMEANPNIFRCEVAWGCYWQETPEDAVALYRGLLDSSVFAYIHSDFWLRDLQTPRLVAWNAADQRRIPQVWSRFVGELENSTNVLWELEARALALADADNDQDTARCFTNLFKAYFTNHDTLVNNPVEVVYLGWHLGNLVDAKTSGGIVTQIRESLNEVFHSQYDEKLNAMDGEYQARAVAGGATSPAFEQQKQYLRNNRPYDFFEFANLFQSRDYSPSQAREIQPWILAYQSNLLAQSESAPPGQRGPLLGGIAQVGLLENDVSRILNPPAPNTPAQPAAAVAPPPAVPPKIVPANPVAIAPPGIETVTNVISVNQAYTIPVERLVTLDHSGRIDPRSQVTVTAHHCLEGRLLLDFKYELLVDVFDTNGLMNMSGESGRAIARFDLATKNWEVIAVPGSEIQKQNRFYNRTTLLNGTLYNCDGGEIRSYDSRLGQWRALKISDGNNYQLFAVNGRLYAANENAIFEIIAGGDDSRMLASNRRRPAVSVLDAQNLGVPFLFEGPNHSLRVSTGARIFTFTGNDWGGDFGAPAAAFEPEAFGKGILFRDAAGGDQPASLSFLPMGDSAAELYLSQPPAAAGSSMTSAQRGRALPGKPSWEMPARLTLARLPAVVDQTNLYLLLDHSQGQSVSGELRSGGGTVGQEFSPRDGYEAALLCFIRDFPQPQKLYLKFDAEGCRPLTGTDPAAPQWMPAMPPVWMSFAGDYLVFGLEIREDSMPYPGMPQRADLGGKATIWLMPASQIQAACATQ